MLSTNQLLEKASHALLTVSDLRMKKRNITKDLWVPLKIQVKEAPNLGAKEKITKYS